MSHTVKIQRDATPRGLFGMTRCKTVFVCLLYFILIGGLVYFVLNWFEIPGLHSQLDQLESELEILSLENAKFAKLNEQLEEMAKDLDVVNKELSETADELKVTTTQLNASVTELTSEVGQLEELNQELNFISDFLNETALDIGESVEQLAELLADQIESSNVLLLANLKQTLSQKTMNWDCTFGAIFGQQSWAKDFNMEIPASAWITVNQYFNENVLEELCLDETDFLQYLSDNHEVWTINSLITAVTAYSKAAMDFYFPAGETGLTHEDWSKASFNCENLATKFKYN